MLHQLKVPVGAKKNPKRVGRGRGSGTGKTSGRGHKGQKSRASGGVRPGFEGGQMPLARLLPKRGFTFTPKAKYEVVSLQNLNRLKVDSEITPEVLLKAKLVRKKRSLVKILGDGELKQGLTIKAHAFSRSALEKIKKAGGQAQEIKVVSQAQETKAKK